MRRVKVRPHYPAAHELKEVHIPLPSRFFLRNAGAHSYLATRTFIRFTVCGAMLGRLRKIVVARLEGCADVHAISFLRSKRLGRLENIFSFHF